MDKEKDYTDDAFLNNALNRLRKNYFDKRSKIDLLFDIESLKNSVKAIKESSIQNIDKLLHSMIDRLNANNIKTSIAEDSIEAVDLIIDILKQNNIKKIVKSKSLTTEEIQLNENLKIKGFDAVETDLGEWLVQINNEPPTHMTAPAIHMPKEKINNLINTTFNEQIPMDIHKMVGFCKNKIREHFKDADAGIIGANIISLESGSFFIVSNEGNIQNVIRKDVVICVVGIDKIVETDKEAFKILELLPKAATGQITTSYIDILKKPFGKFYAIFVDNNRSLIAEKPLFKQTLNCIRCGACQNACPVYTTVGGGYFRGKAYAGPIGILLSYMVNDTKDIREYSNLCIGCMACDEICSSKIDLQAIILSIKAQSTKNTPGIKGLIIKHLENRYQLLRISAYLSHFLFKNGLKTNIKSIDKLFGLDFRALPPIKKSFDTTISRPSKICLFAGCSTNFIYTNIGFDALSLAKKLNIELSVINQRSCCGAPAWYNGEKNSAIKAADINIEHLLSLGCETIIFLDPHCAHMIKRDYSLIADNPKAKELAEKIVCAGSYFIDIIQQQAIKTKRLGSFLGYHHPCHLKRGLNYSSKIENFIEENEPNFIQIKDADRCCGFAGSYSLMHPHISKKLLENKIDSIRESNIQTLITACPGCMMQIAGGLKVQGINIEILHFVSYLDRIVQHLEV